MISRIERWAPISGIVFVVLMVVGSMLVSNVPSPNAPQHQVVSYLTDGAQQMRNIIGAYLWVVGSLTFLVFLVRLRNDLRRAESGTGYLSNLAFGAGAAFAAAWTVAATTSVAVAYAIRLRGAPVTDTDLVRVLPPLGRLVLLLGGGFAGILVLLAASAVIIKTGVFARWLGWLGIVAAIVLAFDVVYRDISPFWVWVFIASIVMLTRRGATARTPLGASLEESAATREEAGTTAA
jgi:uncharacterized membrane protein SirB2